MGRLLPEISNKLNAGFGLSVGMYEHRVARAHQYAGQLIPRTELTLRQVLVVGWIWSNVRVLGADNDSLSGSIDLRDQF